MTATVELVVVVIVECVCGDEVNIWRRKTLTDLNWLCPDISCSCSKMQSTTVSECNTFIITASSSVSCFCVNLTFCVVQLLGCMTRCNNASDSQVLCRCPHNTALYSLRFVTDVIMAT